MLCSRTEKTKKPEKEPGVRKNVSLARYPRETYTIVVMILVGGEACLAPLPPHFIHTYACIMHSYVLCKETKTDQEPQTPPPPKKKKHPRIIFEF